MAKESKTIQNQEVIVGNLQSGRQLHLSKKNFKLILGGILLVFVLLLILATADRYNHKKTSSQTNKLSLQQLSDKVSTAFKDKNYNQAIQLIQSQKTTDKNTLIFDAGVYLSDGKYSQAEMVYKQVASLYGLDLGLAESIASSAMEAKDNQTAKLYFQKAIDLLNKQPQTADSAEAIQQINNFIKAL